VREEAVRERLRAVGEPARWRGTPPEAFAGFGTDSRTVGAGDLFCAILGTRVDGHRFLSEVATAEAGAAVVEEVDRDVDLPQLKVADARRAAAHLASLFRGDPGDRLRLVGVTGTNGKTTTVWMLQHLLEGAGLRAGSIGTLGTIRPNGRVREGELTTPGPVALMGSLADLADAGAEAAALEVSSHALDQRRVDALRFEAAVFTTLTREHLEYHPDMESYRAAKLRLVERVAADGSCAVLAGEEAWARVDFGGRRVVRYGQAPEADVRAEDLEEERDGIAFRLRDGSWSARVRLPMPGRMNVTNALGAWAAARSLGARPEVLADHLEDLPQVPGRFEVLRREPPAVIRDYAHTPDAVRRALATLRSGLAGRLLVVFGAGGDRDPGKRPLLGEAVAEQADLAFVTTDNPRSEDPREISAQVIASMPTERYRVVLDRRQAIRDAMAEAGPGDLVVLLGKGHETYQHVGERKLPFDEARIVRRVAAELEGGGP
jgi:UDP-N-acetylmuramoyl-L-alanyl-D-glutamate--2,6-diaminopimelate ligase